VNIRHPGEKNCLKKHGKTTEKALKKEPMQLNVKRKHIFILEFLTN
jgi:hypothetical protein